MKLSVIVCVYNTERKYLSECLASLRRSTLDCEWETVIVDDGSEYDYSDIANEYGARYFKTENRGHLGARLYGISVARGDFCSFVDSDDTVSLNYHRPMLDAAERLDADIVINGWAFHTERSKRVCTADSTMSEHISALGDENLLLYTERCGREHSYFVNWNKLYRRSVLCETKRRLEALGIADMRLTYSEDALMNFFNFQIAKKTVSINSGYYFYRIHGSQSIVVTGKDKLKSQIDSMSFTLGIMRRNIGNNKYSERISKNIGEWSRLMARTHFSHAKAARAKELYPYIKEKYGVSRNRPASYRDGRVYAGGELLGENFGEIDKKLTELYFSELPTSVRFERRAKCISRIIADMPKKISYSRLGEIYIPKRKIKLKERIIHNRFIYRLGMILFKKGSKIRAFLKKHL